jgi:hypothetical protein
MNKQVNPEELVAGDEQHADHICEKCGALIVLDTVTGEPLCNCSAQAELAAKIAQARKAQKQAQTQSPRPENEPATPASAPSTEEPLAVQDPEEVASEEPMPVFNAKDALMAIPGAPSQEQIDAWKQEWGQIYTFPFDLREIYVWRPIRRREWQMLQSNEALVKEEAKFQEQIVMRCVLWPKIGPVELNLSRAGLVQTLFGVIMQGSYFLHPDFAISLVQEI